MPPILIAHRGNTHGPRPSLENYPITIDNAIANGFHVEVDLRYNETKNEFYLGHDSEQYFIEISWLWQRRDKLFIHAKTIPTLSKLLSYGPGFHCFFHDRDDATITSERKIWLYPRMKPVYNGIVVMPEWISENWLDDVKKWDCYGICSDYVSDIREKID